MSSVSKAISQEVWLWFAKSSNKFRKSRPLGNLDKSNTASRGSGTVSSFFFLGLFEALGKTSLHQYGTALIVKTTSLSRSSYHYTLSSVRHLYPTANRH